MQPPLHRVNHVTVQIQVHNQVTSDDALKVCLLCFGKHRVSYFSVLYRYLIQFCFSFFPVFASVQLQCIHQQPEDGASLTRIIGLEDLGRVCQDICFARFFV